MLGANANALPGQSLFRISAVVHSISQVIRDISKHW
jgi:hypothetical protein